MDEQIRALKEYVYLKYVDGVRGEDLDEVAACERLDEYFSESANANDSECVYAGILSFELGYELEDRQVHYFRRAKYWLERHRAITGESWDAVDDRLEDVNAYFADEGIVVEDTPLPEPVALAPVVVEEISDHGLMMHVPAGTFLFGPERATITLPAYYIDKYPVTNREYEAFCRATGYRFPKYWTKQRFNEPDAPVVGVSLADAQKFSRWVGKQLPTEEQWEKACRGVDGREYPWGEEEASPEHACFGQDSEDGRTEPVTSHPRGASPYGVCELAGNVWEWTSTVVPEEEAVNVIKGGCYNDPPSLLRSHVRLEAAPKDKFDTIGFRCVKGV